MIEFINISKETPYQRFKSDYQRAFDANQKQIEAISISSYSKLQNEVNSRFVNIKYVIDKSFIFFTNYNSQKSLEFKSHNQIAALIYWKNINLQIRIKANIQSTNKEFNEKYFETRAKEKNALAISSNQSEIISSFKQVEENFKVALKLNNLKKCPNYWGGFLFEPYYFEFWQGHDARLNKREVFELNNDEWNSYIIQP